MFLLGKDISGNRICKHSLPRILYLHDLNTLSLNSFSYKVCESTTNVFYALNCNISQILCYRLTVCLLHTPVSRMPLTSHIFFSALKDWFDAKKGQRCEHEAFYLLAGANPAPGTRAAGHLYHGHYWQWNHKQRYGFCEICD